MPSNHLLLCLPLLRPQSFPASGSFPMSWLFASGGQTVGASASASVLPMNIQGRFPLGWTGWISLVWSLSFNDMFFSPYWFSLSSTKFILPRLCVCDIRAEETHERAQVRCTWLWGLKWRAPHDSKWGDSQSRGASQASSFSIYHICGVCLIFSSCEPIRLLTPHPHVLECYLEIHYLRSHLPLCVWVCVRVCVCVCTPRE